MRALRRKSRARSVPGVCSCFAGFSGDACQRRGCVNDCSGHGKCVSMKKMATLAEALPLSAKTTYQGNEDTTRWDQEMVFGCVCDSRWAVGLGPTDTHTRDPRHAKRFELFFCAC